MRQSFLKRSLILSFISLFLLCGCMTTAHAWLLNKNGALSSISSSIALNATSVTLSNGTGSKFPQSGAFRAVIWNSAYSSSVSDASAEYVTATWVSGDTFSIVRAQEGSTAKDWGAGSYFANVISAGKLTELENAIDSKAILNSPTFTGNPTAPTQAADNNSTRLATTAYVLGQAGSSSPAMNGTAAVGTSARYSRQDHVHPIDTTRAAVASPTFTGTVTAPTLAVTGFITHGGKKRVTTQFNKTSDTSLENIPGLTVPVVAGKTYSFQVVIFASGGANMTQEGHYSSGGLFKVALGGTCAASTFIAASSYDSKMLALGSSYNIPSTILVGGQSSIGYSVINGTIAVSSSGTLTVQFAQLYSYAVASSVLVGSTFIVEEMP
jgi:hypothetical protein